jgi:hypothetical protein
MVGTQRAARGHRPVLLAGDVRRRVCEGVAEGARNATLISLCDHMLGQGLEPAVVRELLLAWNRMACRPPLDDDEVARVLASSLRCRQRGRDKSSAD